MSWYAIEGIDKAVEKTKDLLLPFDLGTWLRLALMVIFTGAGFSFFNAPTFPADSNNDYSSAASEIDPSAVPETASNSITELSTASNSVSPALLWIVVGLLIGFIALLMYLSSVFQFIFYQSLLDESVKIRENFSLHSGRGLRYFGFRIGHLIAVIALLVLVGLAFWTDLVLGVLALLLVLPILVLLSVFAGLTRDFVLLEMIENEEKLIESWRNFWPSAREQWKQVAVYLIVKFALGVVVGLAAVTGVVFSALILLIPFGIVGILLSLVLPPLVLIVLLAYLITVAVATLLLMVPLNTFLNYFTILVYQDLRN